MHHLNYNVTKPELSIIVPCYNERENIKPLYEALVKTLKDICWEIIFVDDNSPDKTINEIWNLSTLDYRVRGLLRVNRRGLSSAVIEGVLASSAPYVAIIDGDLQHDETRLPLMLKAVKQDHYDIAVGSRHIEGGQSSGLANQWRHFLSETGIWLAQKLMTNPVHDPMSGFFLCKKDLFVQHLSDLTGKGFKILLDLLMSCSSTTKLIEVPFQFRTRHCGQSKLNYKVMIEFISMLCIKISKGCFPFVFVGFLIFISLGIVINSLVVMLSLQVKLSSLTTQIISSLGILGFSTFSYMFVSPQSKNLFKLLLFWIFSIFGFVYSYKLERLLAFSGMDLISSNVITVGILMIWLSFIILSFTADS